MSGPNMQPGSDAQDNPRQQPLFDETARQGKGVPTSASPADERVDIDVRKASLHEQHKNRHTMSPSPAAVLRYIEAIVRQPLMDEKLLSTMEEGKEGRDSNAAAFRKGSFGPNNAEAFANAEVIRAIMEQAEMQSLSGAGGLDEAALESTLRCYPEGFDGVATTRDCVKELIAWQKLPKTFGRARQPSAPGNWARKPDASDTRAKSNNGSHVFDGREGGEGFLEGGNLAVPNLELSISAETLEEISRQLSEQVEGEAGSPDGSNRTTTDYGLVLRRLGEASATAASQLLFYDDRKFRAQQDDGRPRSNAGAPHRLNEIKCDRLEGLSKYLGITCKDTESVYRGVSGIGALLLFNSLSLDVLKKCCKELGISITEDASMDVHLLTEVLAEKISAYLYPIPDGERLSFSRLLFLPRFQIHECASNTYMCSIDNSRHLGHLPLERYISNRFSCNKIKFRCLLQAKRGFLNIYLWHRHTTPLNAHLLIRTAEARKKRRNGGEKQDNGADSTSSSGGLLVEYEISAEPNELVGVGDFMSLQDALNSSTVASQGLKTYNAAEDRIVFQMLLSISATNGSFLEGQEVLNQKELFDGLPSDTRNQSFDSLSDEDKRQQEFKYVVTSLADDEETAREAVRSNWHYGFRQLQYAEYREAQRARHATRERERKILLAKAGPSPELIRDVEKYKQLVQSSNQQVAKLLKDKAAEEKEAKRLRERVEEGRSEMERLRVLNEEKANQLSTIEEEISLTQKRQMEKRKTIERRRQRRESEVPWDDVKGENNGTTSAHDALAISDFGLFLNNTVGMTSSGSEPIFHTGPQPLAGAERQEAFAFSTGQVGSSADILGGSAAPPVFSTQPHLHSFLETEGLEAATSSHVTPSPQHHRNTPPSPSPMIAADTAMSAFGSMGPSPFSTNPGTHAPMYNQMSEGIPAFRASHSMNNTDVSSSSHTPIPPLSTAPVSAFTVTAGASSGIQYANFNGDGSGIFAPADRPGQSLFYSDPHDAFPPSGWKFNFKSEVE